ncbi:hypothetical protein FO519_001318 [Halicephalobus sp. NKZ332]|nr:hypothetical protein FO519_001318 [Halicephalobus sp. NKZ332]
MNNNSTDSSRSSPICTDSSRSSSSVYSSSSRRTSEAEKESIVLSTKLYSDKISEKEKDQSPSQLRSGIIIDSRDDLPIIPHVENRESEEHQRIRRTKIRLTDSMPCDIPIRLPEYKPIVINEDDFLEINREMFENDGIDVDKKINNVRPRINKRVEEYKQQQKHLYEDED